MVKKSKRSTSSRADSPANLFRLRVGGKLKPIRVGSGRSSYASCLKYDPNSSSWRTYPDSSIEGWPALSVIFPRAGTMLNGVAYRRPMSVRRTSGNGSLSWPTPTVRDYKDVGENTNYEKVAQKSKLAGVAMVRMWSAPTARLADQRGAQAKRYFDPKRSNDLDDAVAATLLKLPTPTATRRTGLQSHGRNVVTGQLNPTWVEWLMGFPLGWTDLEGSATPSSPKSRNG